MTKTTLRIRIALYGLLLSTVIGAISFIFIFLESNISHHIWHVMLQDRPSKPLIILAFTLIGGLIIGGLRSKWGDYPQTAHHTIHQLKTHQTVSYRPVFKSLTVALLILIFGAGVGPEAALLGAIVMLSVWQADKLRYLFFNQDAFLALSPLARLGHMLHPTSYLSTFDPNRASKNSPTIKKYINTLFVINGLFAFTVLMKLTKQPSFISKMGVTHWEIKDLGLLIPLIILGVLAGKLYQLFKAKMADWMTFWPDQPIKKALIGSLGIFGIALLTPNLLFSGQTTLGTVPEAYTSYSVLILILIVVLKLTFLQLCLNTGWVGGDIFPIVFSSIILGFALSQVLPHFDAIFIVAVTATAMAVTIIDSPIVVAIFVGLFFPITIFPIILITAALLKYIQTKKQQGVS